MLPICGACAEAAHTNSAIAKVRVTLIRRWAPPYCCGDSAPCLLLRELPDDGQYDGFALIGCDDQPQPQQETGQLEKPVQTVEAPKPITPEERTEGHGDHHIDDEHDDANEDGLVGVKPHSAILAVRLHHQEHDATAGNRPARKAGTDRR